jgi:hypothetical protein
MSRLYDGTEIVGTEEAIKSEMKNVWARMKGSEGQEMRHRMIALRERCRVSWLEGGARREMEGMSRYF